MIRLGGLLLTMSLTFGCSNEVTGHRNLHSWSSTGAESSQPDVDRITIGVWGESGGFERSTITPLADGRFRSLDAPAGTYFAGIGPAGLETWIVTDSRQLDLDDVAEFTFGARRDAGSVLPLQRVQLSYERFGSLALFSPDTASRIVSVGNQDEVIFKAYLLEQNELVKSWFWQTDSSFEETGGVSRGLQSVRGSTNIVGQPTVDQLQLSFAREPDLAMTGQLNTSALLELVPRLAPSPGIMFATVDIVAVPRVAARPGRRPFTVPSLLRLKQEGPVTQFPPVVDLSVTAQNPFADDPWDLIWSWSVGVPDDGAARFTVSAPRVPSSFEITMTPPRSVTIDGVPATTPRLRFASESPTVSWLAPEQGTPSGYAVEFVQAGTLEERRLLTKSTSVRIPPGFIRSSGAIRVRAISSKVAWAPHPPLGELTEFTSAGTISAVWDPAP